MSEAPSITCPFAQRGARIVAQERCYTWEEAEAQHEAVKQRLLKGMAG